MSDSHIKIHAGTQEETLPTEVGQLSLDIVHTDDEIIIIAPIAGIKKEDISLVITDDVLILRGERPARYLVGDEHYYTRECFWGKFSRSIVLPLEAETTKISATFVDNVLEIHIPKTLRQKTQIIKIKA